MIENKGNFDPLIHVPGVWRCAKCSFRLIQSNLNARDGTVTARDEAGEPCPNCATPLWRVTWREEAEDARKSEETIWERGLEAGKRYTAADAWRPISEAPRDGTHIILAFGQDHACEGWYEDDDNQPRPWAFIDKADFNEVVINHARDGEYGPSHWQPMPYREPRNRPMPPNTTGGGDGR